MSTPPRSERAPEPPPPTEAQRAVHAVTLGIVLGVVLAVLGRRTARPGGRRT